MEERGELGDGFFFLRPNPHDFNFLLCNIALHNIRTDRL